MKEKYLNELNEVLQIAFSTADANTITNDYNELFDDYLSSGLKEAEVIAKLGDPKDIVKSLVEEQKQTFPYIRKRNVTLPKKKRKKIIKAMPLLSVIIFLGLGYGLNAWHPGWLVFLLIPISGILFTPYKKRRISALSPFIAVIIFILVGTYIEGGFYYSWFVFLLIPLAGIIDSDN